MRDNARGGELIFASNNATAWHAASQLASWKIIYVALLSVIQEGRPFCKWYFANDGNSLRDSI